MHAPARVGLSARTRLTLIFLLAIIIAAIFISVSLWGIGRASLTENIEARLTSITNSRANQLNAYFERLRGHVATLTEDEMIINAMVNFNRHFEDLDGQAIPEAWETDLENYYVNTFFPQLRDRVVGELEFEGYRPGGQAAYYVQHQYIVAQADAENRVNVNQAGDGSAYSDTHLRYHARFRRLIENFRYEDLYLIDFETGNVVYSVRKDVDFGTNVVDGPYRRTGLGAVVRAVQANSSRRSVQIVDYQRYQPAFTAPVSFIGGPIYNGPHIVGILVLRMPTAEINRIVSGGNRWLDEGLGATGETYLVGSDLLMRTDGRMLIEMPEQYFEALRAAGVNEPTIERVQAFNTSILFQPVNTAAVREALDETTGIAIQENAFGEQVLTAYTPLDIIGLNWALVSEVQIEEAFSPIREYEARVLLITVVVVVIGTFLSILAANGFLRPLVRLNNGLGERWDDERVTQVGTRSDEFGHLARLITETFESQQAERNRLETVNRENIRLIASQLPQALVPRFHNGNRSLWERTTLGTVIAIELKDYALPPGSLEQTSKTVRQLENAFFDLAERYELELFPRGLQSYLVLSGFSVARPDHTQRAVRFALDLLTSVERIRLLSKTQFSVKIGIAADAIVGGIASERRFIYAIGGAAAEQAQDAVLSADANTIIVTDTVRQTTHELFDMTPTAPGYWKVGAQVALVDAAREAQP